MSARLKTRNGCIVDLSFFTLCMSQRVAARKPNTLPPLPCPRAGLDVRLRPIHPLGVIRPSHTMSSLCVRVASAMPFHEISQVVIFKRLTLHAKP